MAGRVTGAVSWCRALRACGRGPATSPDATTVRGFQRRLATEDLAVAMNYHHTQKVATAHAITAYLLPRQSIPTTNSTNVSNTRTIAALYDVR